MMSNQLQEYTVALTKSRKEENSKAQSKQEAKRNETVKFGFVTSKLVSITGIRKKGEINFHGEQCEFCLGTWNFEVFSSTSRQKHPTAMEYIWEMSALHTEIGSHGPRGTK